MKKKVSLLLAAVMIVSILAGCGGAAQTPPAAPGTTTTPGTPADSNVPVQEAEVKEAPVLADQVAAGTLPALEERLPAASDVYVEAAYTPAEVPSYGGTMRFRNGGKWDFGPTTEEPLFRLLADGTVEANVAKGYDLSSDGLTYTIYLREGMKWSDGTPFTASDCVYYYNYVLVPEVDNATGKVTKSHTTKYYNWYMSEDPTDGILKPAQVFMLMTLILSLISWPDLSRVVRSKFISVKNEDFIMAARISGAPASKVITKHMIPSFTSYIIVNMTMAIPNLIIGETTLSFLGLGLRSPATSWGVLLQETNKLATITFYGWKLIPMIFVFLTVLTFNFVGDGLRDAADPYK